MFANNKEFYPTPQTLIEKMIEGLEWKRIHTILEPSAGKGDIVDALRSLRDEWNREYNFDVDCIELDQNLRHILKGRKIKVVHDDFMTYDTMKEYDLIIMNPPFSNGCKHLLKALSMQQRNGGAVICVLNAETLKNLCSDERIILSRQLEKYDADIQYIQEAFVEAERKTEVEIALIKVQLPPVQKISFILDNLRRAKEEREYKYTENSTQIAENDFLKSVVEQYKMEAEAGIRLIKEYHAMSPYIMREFKKDEKTGEVNQSGGCSLYLTISENGDVATINDYIKEIREKYWKALFNNPKFIGQLTEKLRREYFNKVSALREYDFSLYNIYEIKADMLKKVARGIEDTIVDLFDEFSHKYYYYDETSNNIHYFNGWKTNKAWIINKKVIIPLAAYKDMSYSWGHFRPTVYDVASKLRDIEKCFNYLDGGLTEAIDLTQALETAEAAGQAKNISLKYFTVTFYKKGTCHITFKDEELLKKFNIFGAQHKGWLPPSYGKKGYEEMTSEEKVVINEFEGEAAYKKVMSNAKYYLFDATSFALLENKAM